MVSTRSGMRAASFQEVPPVLAGVRGHAADLTLLKEVIGIAERRNVGQVDSSERQRPAAIESLERGRDDLAGWGEDHCRVQGLGGPVEGVPGRGNAELDRQPPCFGGTPRGGVRQPLPDRQRSAEVFTDVDEELAVGLAAAAGVAIENARLHTRLQELGLVEDRERIARDLHDTVIQRLFATGMSLQGTARLVRTDPSAAVGRIESAVDDLDLTVKHVRTAIFGLEQRRTPDDGLRNSILALLQEAAGPLGFEPRVLLDGPIDTGVGDGIGAELLATLREALSNVARHARASRVDVEVVVGGDVSLRVCDDGVGPPLRTRRRGTDSPTWRPGRPSSGAPSSCSRMRLEARSWSGACPRVEPRSVVASGLGDRAAGMFQGR